MLVGKVALNGIAVAFLLCAFFPARADQSSCVLAFSSPPLFSSVGIVNDPIIRIDDQVTVMPEHFLMWTWREPKLFPWLLNGHVSLQPKSKSRAMDARMLRRRAPPMVELNQPDIYDDLRKAFERLHNRYRGRVSDEELAGLKSKGPKDFVLGHRRTSVIVVKRGETPVGLLMVFDGSLYDAEQRNSIVTKPMPVQDRFDQNSPLNLAITNMRGKKQHVYELAKFWIDEDLPEYERAFVKAEIYSWLFANYFDPRRQYYVSANFIIDPLSRSHFRMFRAEHRGSPLVSRHQATHPDEPYVLNHTLIGMGSSLSNYINAFQAQTAEPVRNVQIPVDLEEYMR
jgi:hypothetical protein